MVKVTLICVPTLDEGGLLSEVSIHFGKSPYFTLIELEKGEIKEINVTKSTGRHRSGSKTPAEIIIGSRANVLICGNLGPKAISMLRNSEIEVFSGASGKVKDVIKEWKRGMLSVTDKSPCKGEGC